LDGFRPTIFLILVDLVKSPLFFSLRLFFLINHLSLKALSVGVIEVVEFSEDEHGLSN
jgi:hypothetical protein